MNVRTLILCVTVALSLGCYSAKAASERDLLTKSLETHLADNTTRWEMLVIHHIGKNAAAERKRLDLYLKEQNAFAAGDPEKIERNKEKHRQSVAQLRMTVEKEVWKVVRLQEDAYEISIGITTLNRMCTEERSIFMARRSSEVQPTRRRNSEKLFEEYMAVVFPTVDD